MQKTKYTISPKAKFYHANGTGRDTYINSGGLTFSRPQSAGKAYDSGRFFNFSTGSKAKATIHAKVTHYPPAGDGRDYYVVLNSGGMTNNAYTTGESKYNFWKSLRTYEKNNEIKQRPSSSKKEMDITNELATSQKNLNEKLAHPKSKRIPYYKFLA